MGPEAFEIRTKSPARSEGRESPLRLSSSSSPPQPIWPPRRRTRPTLRPPISTSTSSPVRALTPFTSTKRRVVFNRPSCRNSTSPDGRTPLSAPPASGERRIVLSSGTAAGVTAAGTGAAFIGESSSGRRCRTPERSPPDVPRMATTSPGWKVGTVAPSREFSSSSPPRAGGPETRRVPMEAPLTRTSRTVPAGRFMFSSSTEKARSPREGRRRKSAGPPAATPPIGPPRSCVRRRTSSKSPARAEPARSRAGRIVRRREG